LTRADMDALLTNDCGLSGVAAALLISLSRRSASGVRSACMEIILLLLLLMLL
jgi:hypothetical protein